ncbi:uncharacterized protein LOC123673151 [Harmonia axyridis]|uniref:uncharacterized protein LOC123673151 n=1 Tax=Harmonia axyridis TaxID=115357 RepID=UPI001E27759F|nr:uncharacterized protein LOC123673151 [Harmonia axyridis]
MDNNQLKLQWSLENIEKFINLYKQHGCLWNPELDSYKNFHLKKSALQKMVADMRMHGLTTFLAKERIKTIRTMYRRELNKVVNSSANGGKQIYRPKLFWFKQIDSFLRPVTILRNFGNQNSSMSQNTEVNGESDDNFSVQDQRIEDDFRNQSSIQIEEYISNSRCTTPMEQSNKKRKCSSNDFYDVSDLQSNSNNFSGENEFDLFAKLIAVLLKKLPLKTAIQCKQEMINLVFSKQIELLENNNVQAVERTNNSSEKSPLSGYFDIEYDEKPNIHKDTMNHEKDI